MFFFYTGAAPSNQCSWICTVLQPQSENCCVVTTTEYTFLSIIKQEVPLHYCQMLVVHRSHNIKSTMNICILNPLNIHFLSKQGVLHSASSGSLCNNEHTLTRLLYQHHVLDQSCVEYSTPSSPFQQCLNVIGDAKKNHHCNTSRFKVTKKRREGLYL